MTDELMIAYDEAGGLLRIPRKQWAAEVLPNTFASAWNDADQLYRHITMAIEDGFAECVFPAARRLLELEPCAERTRIMLDTIRGALDEAVISTT